MQSDTNAMCLSATQEHRFMRCSVFIFASTHDFLGERILRRKTDEECDLEQSCAKMDGFLKGLCQNGDSLR